MDSFKESILNYLEQHPNTFFTGSDLSRRLKIKRSDRRKFRSSLKALAKQGQLMSASRGRRFAYSSERGADSEERVQKMAEKTLAQCMNSLIEEFQLPTKFSKKVLTLSKEIDEKILEEEIKNRRDLRSQITVTIDGENAKDFDDAISVEDIGRNAIRLRVSIADVSHFVTPGNAIDKEAYARGTSIYFPDRVFPMLPEKLSNDVCSLVPHKDRLCFTAEIDFNREGRPIRTDFYKSIIRSTYRLTYTQVTEALVKKDPKICHDLRHILPHLKLMEKLFLKLRKSRIKRGSLDFDLPEPEIVMDMEEGRIDTIVKAERTASHMMIEEFMIAANEAVARFITEHNVPMVYRLHEEPNQEKLKELQLKLHNLGYSLKISKKKIEPKIFTEIINKSLGKPESRMIHTLILRSLAKAIYSSSNKGHFGLASTCYTHFTSPIRRYPDLMVHRILSDILRLKTEEKSTYTFDLLRLDRMAEHCSLRERLSMQAEWAVRDLMKVVFMEAHIGEDFAGIISDVTRFGIFVELTKYFVEGLIHIRNLNDDYYRFIETSHTLLGKRTKRRFRIGDSVWVKVMGTDTEKRWIDFELVDPYA